MKIQEVEMYQTQHLPEVVTHVKKEIIKNFTHSKRVGGFLLGRTLGVGSFAKVKEGLHLTTGEKVAVKVIDKKRAKTDSYVRKNLRREGRLLQLVRHPNIVALFEVMETDNSYYLVTELCRGGDLMEYITTRKRLPEIEVIKFIRQIVSAIDYLHRLGIIHRDLKIENLLLDGNKNIKLIDFGLSNSIKVSTSPNGTRAQEFCVTQCGSPAYAAPELLNHEKYGLQVDLWSIGVNMYAMLTGGLPFTVEPFNIKALYTKMRDRQMNPVPDDLSKDCKDLLKKFLNPDPVKRVTVVEALNHPFLTQGNKPVPRPPCPNKIRTSDLETEILSHMSENLGFRMGEVIKFVTCNTPSPACATYHLYLHRLTRYHADVRVSSQNLSKKPTDGKITLHLQDLQHQTVKEALKSSSPKHGHPSQASLATVNSNKSNSSTQKELHTGAVTVKSIGNGDKKENQSPVVSLNIQRSDMSTPKSQIQSGFTPRLLTKRTLQENALTKDNTDIISSPLSSHNEKIKTLATQNSLDIVATLRSVNIGGTIRSDDVRQFPKHLQHQVKQDHVSSMDPPVAYPVSLTSDKAPTRTRLLSRQQQIVKKEVLNIPKNNNEKDFESRTMRNNLENEKDALEISKKQEENKKGSQKQSGLLTHLSQPLNLNKNENTKNIDGVNKEKFNKFTNSNSIMNKQSNIILIKQWNRNNSVQNNCINKTKLSSRHPQNDSTTRSSVRQGPSFHIKSFTKQFVPFRGAQEKPRLSIDPTKKEKVTIEALSLHGKNISKSLNESFKTHNLNADFNSAVKRPVSPSRPVAVIRRRLAKRYRIGELSSSGSKLIDGVEDLNVVDELKNTSPSSSRPLPSISTLRKNSQN